MGFSINPSLPRNRVVSGIEGATGPTQSENTAAKVKQIRLPNIQKSKPALRDRQVTPLDEANDLARSIKAKWDELAPDELAESIIDLEDKVSHLKGTSPAVEKIKRLVQNLHFKFVFPIALEMDTAESAISVSFARTVYKAANEIFKTGSLAAFNRLSETQRREVKRLASGRF